MKSHVHQRGFTPVQAFRFQFQRRLNEYRQRYGSVAEGFGVIWEETLEEVPVDDKIQGELYRELLNWARQAALFTTAVPETGANRSLVLHSVRCWSIGTVLGRGSKSDAPSHLVCRIGDSLQGRTRFSADL